MEYSQEPDRRGKVVMLPIKDANGSLLKPGKVTYFNVGDPITVLVNGESKTDTIKVITPEGIYISGPLGNVPVDVNTIQVGGRKNRKTRKSRKNKSRRYRRV
jgi:hypothetical protein